MCLLLVALFVSAPCSALSSPERVRSSRDPQVRVIPCTAWCALEVLDCVAMWPIKPEQEKQGVEAHGRLKRLLRQSV